jgi:hypothetical protein
VASIRKRNGLWQAQVRSRKFGSTSKSFHKKSDAVAWAKVQEAKTRTLKQENRMKTLSKWLMATSLSIISFVVFVMLYAQIRDKYLLGKPDGCWEISCS